jgi:hypothetical protein
MPENWGMKLVIYVPTVVALMFGVAFCATARAPVPPEKPVPQQMESEGTAKPEQSDTQANHKNSHVSDALNAADITFGQGMDGCPGVAIAIAAANDSFTFGPTGSSQIQELKQYAKRCNLRF